MSSLILQTATRVLRPMLLLYSVYLLLTGHHEPGGGFSAGLIASAAVALSLIAEGAAKARRLVSIVPQRLIGLGLLLAVASGLPMAAAGRPFLTAAWADLPVPGFGPVAIGTPLLFDAGVYLLVIGTTTTMLFSLAEE